MLANSLIELDRAHLVHPVASYRSHEAMGVRVLKSAKGATVTDATGHTLLDGFAGLWCVNVGYGQDSIVEAAAKQLRELPYATGYFGLGSEPAIRLAARLAELAPGDLNHIYFTLGGSDAVDSTIRFIRYYYHAKGYAAEGPVHLGRVWLPWLLDGGIRADRDTGLSHRLRRALRLAAQDSVALCLSQSGRLRPAGDHRRVGRRPAGARSRNSARTALPPSTPSPSRDREASSCRRRAG